MRRLFLLSLMLGIVAFASAARAGADDLTGEERVLCAAVEATRCMERSGCISENPWNLNIPEFIEIDLKAKTFSTTKASGENRMTPIRSLAREEGLVILQGYEAGRAFSFVIHEESGMASVAVARDGITVSVFGVCTPMPKAPTK
jgi:hypothetical protein